MYVLKYIENLFIRKKNDFFDPVKHAPPLMWKVKGIVVFIVSKLLNLDSLLSADFKVAFGQNLNQMGVLC